MALSFATVGLLLLTHIKMVQLMEYTSLLTITKYIPELIAPSMPPGEIEDCTPVFVFLLRFRSSETFSIYRKNPIPMLLASSPLSLKSSNSNMKYLPQCSYVVYWKFDEQSVFLNLDENWITELPGMEPRSFHFFISGGAMLNTSESSFVRRLGHAVLVIPKVFQPPSERLQLLVPNRHGGMPMYFTVGELSLHAAKVEFQNVFWNKWRDLRGGYVSVTVPPTQSEATFKQCREGKECQYPVTEISETVKFLNATPKVLPVSLARGFGRRLPNGTWDSYIGKLMDDAVDFTSPFSPMPHQYRHILVAKPVMFSQLRFLTPLPVMAGASRGVDFLVQPFDDFVWVTILICIAANVTTAYVVTAYSWMHPLREKISLWGHPEWMEYVSRRLLDFPRILIDQAIPSEVFNERSSTGGIRILYAVWLLSAIVIGNLYKSVSISILVEPVYIQPPRNRDQLIKSDFQVNSVLYKALLEPGLPWAQSLKYPVKDFGIDFLGCLRTILKGRNTCLFVYHWLYLLAAVDLVDESGQLLFLSSEEVSGSYASSFSVSHKNPQLKRILDKISDAILEGGLNQNWIESLFYRRYLQTIHRKQKQVKVQSTKLSLVDDKLLMYPLLIGLVGVALGGLTLLGECVRHQRSSKSKTTIWRDIWINFSRKSQSVGRRIDGFFFRAKWHLLDA